ncbi:MAG: hypothetical protein Q9160_001111 [Pyrenula sp. 1 TL-2023]
MFDWYQLGRSGARALTSELTRVYLFSPLAFPSGSIILNWTVSTNHEPSVDAFPFEINRTSQIIIGIADGPRIQNPGKNDLEDDGTLASLGKRIVKLYDELLSFQPSENAYVLYKLLVFDIGRPRDLGEDRVDFEFVPTPEQSRTTTIKTIICDILAVYLGQTEDLARNIQDLPAIDSPLALQRERVRQESIADKVRQRMSGAPGQPSRSPVSPGALGRGPASPGLRSPARGAQQDAVRSRSSVRYESNTPSKEQSQDRSSLHGVSAMTPSERKKSQAKGRIRVVIGNMYLQAGRWPDALKELSEAAMTIRMNSDYLWHAKALDLILVSLIMLSWAGMDFSIPPICYPVPEKPQTRPAQSTPSASSSDITTKTSNSTERNNVAKQAFAKLIPDLIAYILNLYTKAANFSQETLPQLLIFESIVRYGGLLKVLHLRGGALDQDGLDHIVRGTSVNYDEGAPIMKGDLSKVDISKMLSKAIPSSTEELSLPEAIAVFTGLASIMSVIGLQRKMAFTFRELLSIITPGLVEARKLGAAEMGLHPAAGLSTLMSATNDLERLSFSANNVKAGLQHLLTALSTVYGIVRKKGPSNDKPDSDKASVDEIERRHRTAGTLQNSGDLALKIEVLECCVDICEALPDFSGVVEYSTQLLRAVRRTNFMPKPYEMGCPWMSQDEQNRLSNNIRRTVAAANKLGLPEIKADFWDDFLVRGIELVEASQAARLIPHSKKDLEVVGTVDDKVKKDPFIFNPFAKTAQDVPAEKLVIAGETLHLKVTLQNPFDISVEVDDFRLWTEGCDFEPLSQSTLLEPYCLQEITLSGCPTKAGQLEVQGCIATIKCCRERRFPIFTREWAPPEDAQMKRIGLKALEPEKDRPVSSTSNKSRKAPSKKLEADSLTVTVLEPQPVIEVDNSSLPLAAVMVLEGETRTFDITLTNTSDVLVDLFLVTLQDSATKQIQTALNNKEITPADLYEHQLQLSERPVFQWLNDDPDSVPNTIPPANSITLTIEIYGRSGLTDGSVQIDYAYLGMPKSAVKGQFYTRKLVFPVNITVNAGAEIFRCNLLSFSSDFAWSNLHNHNNPTRPFIEDDKTPTALAPSPPNPDAQFPTLLSKLGPPPYGTEHSLLLLDFRNVWPHPLTITVQSLPSPSSTWSSPSVYTTTSTLQPGHTSRLILLVPRIHIPSPYAPIPTLTPNRQFIVSQSSSSPSFQSSELLARESFWYRESLLPLLLATWTDPSTSRSGAIDLRRGIRLTPRMIDALRVEDVEVSYSVSVDPTTSPSSFSKTSRRVKQTSPSTFLIPPHTFLTLTVRIHNCHPSAKLPLPLIVRMQPSLRHQGPAGVALDLSKRLAWSGVLQRVVRERSRKKKRGQGSEGGGGGEEDGGVEEKERTVNLGICALVEGEFEVGVVVEEVIRRKTGGKGDGGRKEGGQGQGLEEGLGLGRRIWHAREACVLVAKEQEEQNGSGDEDGDGDGDGDEDEDED